MYDEILSAFARHRDPAKAEPMARYMKNLFPFLGLSRPQRNSIQAEFIKRVRRGKSINWDFVDQCWYKPEREYQYLAMDYLDAVHRCLQAEDLPKLKVLITSKSWWDTVDFLAARLVGRVGLNYPDIARKTCLEWAADKNIWLVRTAILFQLKYKQATDSDLLSRIILLNNNSPEFFIKKAIGWALREYSKTNPAWVKEFIKNHPLQPLSIKEGSKYI